MNNTLQYEQNTIYKDHRFDFLNFNRALHEHTVVFYTRFLVPVLIFVAAIVLNVQSTTRAILLSRTPAMKRDDRSKN